MLVAKTNTEGQKVKTLLEGVLYYLNIILKYKIMIAVITGITALGIVTYAAISVKLPPEKSPMPNVYTANAILAVTEEDTTGIETLVYNLGIESPNARRNSEPNPGMFAIRILTTRSVVDEIVEKFPVAEKYKIEPWKKTKLRMAIINRTEFRFDRNNMVLVINYEDEDPQFAADIINYMLELLLSYFKTKGGDTKQNQLITLEKKLMEINEKIATLEARILDFQQRYGALTIEELAETQANMLESLRSQQILKEMEIKNYTTFTKIEDPYLRRLKAELANIEDLIKEVEKGNTSSGQFMPSKNELPALALQYTKMTTDLQIQRRIYETISQQYEVAKLTLETSPKYQVLEYAEVPDEKSGPARGQLCALATIGAFFGSCALALGLNFLKSIQSIPEGGRKRKRKKKDVTDEETTEDGKTGTNPLEEVQDDFENL